MTIGLIFMAGAEAYHFWYFCRQQIARETSANWLYLSIWDIRTEASYLCIVLAFPSLETETTALHCKIINASEKQTSDRKFNIITIFIQYKGSTNINYKEALNWSLYQHSNQILRRLYRIPQSGHSKSRGPITLNWNFSQFWRLLCGRNCAA